MSRTHSAGAATASAAPVFAALGDPTRLRVISRLCSEGPLSIAQLSENSKITRQAITKHLHVLASAGLTRDRRHGRERIWELEPSRLQAAQDYLGQISANWDAALGRLRAFVEK